MLDSRKKSSCTTFFLLIFIFVVSISMGLYVYKTCKNMQEIELQNIERMQNDFEILTEERL